MSIEDTVAYAGRCHIPDIHVLVFPDQSVQPDPDTNESNRRPLDIRQDIRGIVWMSTQFIPLIESGVSGSVG